MKTVIVIPARYGSSRLPGKPLADIVGKPMIQHVYERASAVGNVDAVWVATDDQRVMDCVAGFGGNAVMTSPDHVSGTDRLVEVMDHVEADLYINVQGDEPLIRSDDLERLAATMQDVGPGVHVGTLCHPISHEEAQSPNSVKVVLKENGDALYFSRSPIPFPREPAEASFLKHVGVYAYRRDVLERYGRLASPMLERSEVLEQLRLLYAGMTIRAVEVEPTGPGVDTPECLERVRAHFLGQECVPVDPLAKVRLVITDVDGILTDGRLHYTEAGETTKTFHVRDGLGIKMLMACGVQVAILSGRDSPTLRKRAADLGIEHVLFGVKDKAAACRALQEQTGVSREETACLGDDSIDLPAFGACGLSFTVSDAPDYIASAVTGVLPVPGGAGALRHLGDRILEAQGNGDVFRSVEGYSRVMHSMAQ
ncbi:MAG: 3-deoxy-manno-octulosonate cytidylyltransferase [Salinicola sp.]|uniref:3-deoxy-manno-octulosonate cytidylyltransferase n=1 Tax=uncultured Salinicola sp. TaxID=1193542 RepID=UPI000C899CA5|nr:3-deoxy-manno-octulosonate cytidylyltransferase [uncultured Salinicola sp.]MAM58328.1 3-deoxy-manno-octulosonate cytidylyltransferase [Salinicola sp.]